MRQINFQRRGRAFTTIELMVVVTIGLILMAAAAFSSYATIKKARLTKFGTELGSLLERARGMAVSRGCPTRLILCDQINCQGPVQLSSSQNSIRAVSVGLLRYAPVDTQLDCSSPLHSGDDGFDFWDLDARPILIPSGISISAIYAGSGTLDVSDWSQSSSMAANRSIWFQADGQFRSPSESAFIDDKKGLVYFQIRDESCDPLLDDQCVGWLISMDRDGASHLTSCGTDLVPCRGLQD